LRSIELNLFKAFNDLIELELTVTFNIEHLEGLGYHEALTIV
jgi:hypothetical protein